MNKLKTILTLIGIILAALAVLAVIGFIYTVAGYIMILAVVCLGGYIAFRLFGTSDDKQIKQISAPDPKRELEKVQRLLDEYKRK
jgi:4-hydroxybenzoate polyprenyltransferase